jgi:hypothetical protein
MTKYTLKVEYYADSLEDAKEQCLNDFGFLEWCEDCNNDIETLKDDELITEYGVVVRELQNRGFNAKMQLLDKNEVQE